MQAFVDTEGYPNLSGITGVEQWPDFATVKSKTLLLLELTVGFETNIKKNFDRKATRFNSYLLSYQTSTKLLCKFKFGCYWHNKER